MTSNEKKSIKDIRKRQSCITLNIYHVKLRKSDKFNSNKQDIRKNYFKNKKIVHTEKEKSLFIILISKIKKTDLNTKNETE